MKAVRIAYILLMFLLVCSCSREGSVISDYRSLAKELKANSSDYSTEEWKKVVRKYKKLENKASHCHFSPKEKKELNRLRGQCAAYMLKSITKQAKLQMKDAMEQFSDMAEGFNEALGEEGVDGLFNDVDE